MSAWLPAPKDGLRGAAVWPGFDPNRNIWVMFVKIGIRISDKLKTVRWVSVSLGPSKSIDIFAYGMFAGHHHMVELVWSPPPLVSDAVAETPCYLVISIDITIILARAQLIRGLRPKLTIQIQAFTHDRLPRQAYSACARRYFSDWCRPLIPHYWSAW